MASPTAPSKVSDHLADFLANQGIRHVFGIIGSGNAHVFDSIAQRGYTQIICVHHEQAAVMAAGIYFRVTGKVSAALLTTGAGSANGVTGVVSTYMDSIPVLVISGNENSRFTRSDNPLRIWGIQGYDSTAMVSRMTKYSARIMEPAQIMAELNRAYTIAREGRPGPVWIDIPMNVQAAPVEATDLVRSDPPSRQSVRGPAVLSGPALKSAAANVVDLLRSSKRPLLWLGNGIRLAGGEALVERLLEALGAPALVTWQAIDIVDSDHPLVYGRAGLYGQRAGNFILQNCDALIAIGTRIAVPQMGYELSEFVRAARVACVDIDLAETKKHGEKIQLPICADAKEFMEALLQELGPDARGKFAQAEWKSYCDRLREKYPWVGPEHGGPNGMNGEFINSYPFMEKIQKYFHKDQLIVTDMGTALLSGHQVLKTKNGQRLMTSTGLGEMGFGLPAAIGASFGGGEARAPGSGQHAQVLCLNCDGGMMMNLQELQTIVHHRLPIKIVVFNNDGYLMIKHTQKALFKGRYAGTDVKSGVSCPDYTRLGQAFGMKTFQIRTWEDLDRVMPEFQAESGPSICEVFMHPEQLFLPKLSLAPRKDGSIVSPPLEDLSPVLPRDEFRSNMLIPIHPKSEEL